MKVLTGKSKSLIGMVHVHALPGTPKSVYSMKELRDIAVDEAKTLVDGGFDAICVENMHDVPYLNRRVGPEIVSAMSVILSDICRTVKCPVGVQILAGANREAMAAAHAAGAKFIRAEGFVFSHVADEGLMNSDAGELLRYRKGIGADDILVMADIKKKHSSHQITSDVSLADTARAAEFFGADGLVITGPVTGSATNPGELRQAKEATELPILVGSGVTPQNLVQMWPLADAFIIGSYLKKDGRWDMPLDKERISEIIESAGRLKNT